MCIHDYLYYYKNGIVGRTITRLFDRCAYGYCARARLSVNRDRKMCWWYVYTALLRNTRKHPLNGKSSVRCIITQHSGIMKYIDIIVLCYFFMAVQPCGDKNNILPDVATIIIGRRLSFLNFISNLSNIVIFTVISRMRSI